MKALTDVEAQPVRAPKLLGVSTDCVDEMERGVTAASSVIFEHDRRPEQRMIPSPVNLSTVPPKRCTPSASDVDETVMILAHSSGSSSACRSIDPLTSANRW